MSILLFNVYPPSLIPDLSLRTSRTFSGIPWLKITVSPCLHCSGLLHDYFGNYTVAFSLAGVPPMVGGVVLFFVPLIHRRLQRGQAAASPEETSTTAHMLPTAPPAEEPKSCSNGDILPGYTDVETHIWVATYKGDIYFYILNIHHVCAPGSMWMCTYFFFLHVTFLLLFSPLGIQPTSTFSHT